MAVNSNADWVDIDTASEAKTAWRCTSVEHLPGAVNRGRHNVFISCYGEDGQQIYRGPAIRWGWEGQHADEAQPPKQFDKKPPDPSTDIPIDKGQHIWIEVADPIGTPSDRVSNLRSDIEGDPATGNSMYHNSYAVRFDLLAESVLPPAAGTLWVPLPADPPPTVPHQPPTGDTQSPYLHGLHDAGGEQLMLDAGKPGWVVFTEAVGSDPNDHSGKDYRQWSSRGLGIIARLNNGYGSGGTISAPDRYTDFAQRCANFVAASPGCKRWIIGNEISLPAEWPNGQRISLADYVRCFSPVRTAIKAVQPDAIVIPQAPAPWNDKLKYSGNPTGDWVRQLADMLMMIGVGNVDGIALHTYTHGSDPALLTSTGTMQPPFENRHYEFLAYQDFMQAIPPGFRNLPVYITECDQNDPWGNQNTGWVQAAFAEIDRWNQQPSNQQIHCLALYRWSREDQDEQWSIQDKPGVIEDFKAAIQHGYHYPPAQLNTQSPTPEPWQVGDSVSAVVTVNIRNAPGYAGAVTGQLNPGEPAQLVGGPRVADGLVWWQSAAGWMAQAVDSTKLLTKTTTIHLRLPFDGSFPITQRFGENLEDYAKFGLKGHTGTDYAVAWGTKVLATDDGVATEVGRDPNGYGLYTKIVHTWGESLVAHLSQQLVSEGQTVSRGEPIGLSGATGNVHGVEAHTGLDVNNRDGSHLHFSVRIYPYSRNDGYSGWSDPEKYLA